MALGQSYWHVSQGIGSQFVPGELAGYFNDMRGKACWTGPTDESGLPVARVNGTAQHFPTLILQRGLGNWDRWLQTERSDSSEYEDFARVARWVLLTQDRRGGWPLPVVEPSAVSPYSAMIQGQAISVLCRAYLKTQSQQYLRAATRAAELMVAPVSQGGTSRLLPAGVILEENPSEPAITVLNGWIFALFGLYDLALISSDSSIHASLSSSVEAVAGLLPTFDAGFWSYYDSAGSFASPFYHRLHVAQLRAMQVTFPEHSPTFASTADRFEHYLSKVMNSMRAVLKKGRQKLRNPPTVFVE